MAAARKVSPAASSDSVLLRFSRLGELGDTGSLADAVDANHQVHRDGRRLRKDQWLRLAKQYLKLFFQSVAQLASTREMLGLDPLAQCRHERIRRLYADIAPDKCLFQLIPELIGDLVMLKASLTRPKS